MKGKYDAYMLGLGGPKSENVEKPLVFVCFFDRAEGLLVVASKVEQVPKRSL